MNILTLGLGLFLAAVGVELTIDGCKTVVDAFKTKKD